MLFVGSSDDDLRDFPAAARRAAGFELSAVQTGLMPSDFKPMATVGPGAYEIRVHVEGEWRVIYVAKFARAVHALHAFRKKTLQDSTGRHRNRQSPLRASQGGREMSKPKMTAGSGNVFADLGFSPEEAALLKMRADLMNELRQVIEARGWTQVAAARELGISQSRVSDLVRGKWQQFSLDMLVTLAVRAGRQVNVGLVAG